MAIRAIAKWQTNLAVALSVSVLSHCNPLAAQGLKRSTATSVSTSDAVAFREETQAYTIGLQAVIYGQPIVSLSIEMNRQASPYANWSPGSDIAPVNTFYNYKKLIDPGTANPRAPNRDTIYYRAWIDLRASPLIVTSPDTNGRYYNLDYVDMYSETAAHTGRRTTGTAEQKAFVVGPDWTGKTPAGMTLVRMATNQGLIFGRMYVAGPDDTKVVNELISRFKVEPFDPAASAPPLKLATGADYASLDFFAVLNRFLRENTLKPQEEALMGMFDLIGIGPSKAFDPANISPATRRGLERALKDGRMMIRDGRRVESRGWASVANAKLGVYGYDYFTRASVNYTGLLANLPEEAVYPRVSIDPNGHQLTGERRYRLVFDKPIPVDAFWSLTPYDAMTYDLIANPLKRYSLGSNTPGLKIRKDGSIVVEVATTAPKDHDVNWLPVSNGPYFLTMRLYQPRPEVLDGSYKLPEIQEVQGTARSSSQ